jgi:membrane protein
MTNAATEFLMVVYRQIRNDRVFDLSAALAYYTLLSIFPLLLLVLAATGLFLSPEVQERLVDALVDSLPTSRDLIVQNLEQVAQLRGPVGIVAFIFLIWTGSNAFGATERMLNRVWHVDRDRAYFLGQARRVVMGGTAGGLLTVSLGIVITTQAATGRLNSVLATSVGVIVAGAISVCVFVLIYRFVPHAVITWKQSVSGGVVGGLGFEIGKLAFALYAANYANFTLVYGALGGTIAFLVWIYWSSVFLFVGAEVAYVADSKHREPRKN